ncbi:TetR/AcrR family transcriptional regulator [Williamsia sp. CHRR-6]|uniref:TetR/AcrR family transcriptional regulator n=1 Tax=Williamsia sp. CHRR-6 TaxID=2835871 RepID=UPI001BD98154|nr:TetR/AcrR family transcriptional regulator [Williamsia sp. CHRR-6]MBT0565403.1 TetR/AcrR family transcriptional regulator [Williamsia sp. CHRR-6]
MTPREPILSRPDGLKAARIEAAARDLLLRRGSRGLTVAEIARVAGVGKGTAYLYWPSKEDLFISLVADDLAEINKRYRSQVLTDAESVMPSRFCVHVLESSQSFPLLHAFLGRDRDVFAGLVDDPRSREMVELAGPRALLDAILPVWRRHGIIDTDTDPGRQAFVLDVLLQGFVERLGATNSDPLAVDDPAATLAQAVALVVGERRPPDAALADAVGAAVAHVDVLSETLSRMGRC